MKRSICTAAVALLILICPRTAETRRLPAVGGEVRIHLGDLDRTALSESLTSSPLVEPAQRTLSPAAAAAWPTLDGQARSRFIVASESLNDGARWTLTARGAVDDLTAAVSRCLTPGSSAWPGKALAAAGVKASVRTHEGKTEVRFDAPVGDLLLVISGCPAQAGAFSTDVAGVWTARVDAPGGRPLLSRVHLVSEPAEADLLPAADSTGGELLVADWPDVWLLLQDSRARAEDPWRLGSGDEALARFQHDLAPELILAVHRGGRGAATQSLLPPGVAPDHGAPQTLTKVRSTPLTLLDLPLDAPGIRIEHDSKDKLADDLKQRLALLLRARGWRVESSDSPAPTTRIVRWRPPVADPALAILLLAAEFDLPLPSELRSTLLSADRASRTAAALTIEHGWMDAELAIPLLTAAHTLVISPRLRGVRLRGDGIPVLDDAWWTQP